MEESHLERGRGGGMDQMTKVFAACMHRSLAFLRRGDGTGPARVSLLLVSLAVLSVLVVCAGSARADVYWINCCNSEKTVEYEKDTWNQYFVGRAGPEGGAAEPEFANAAPEDWLTRNVTVGAGIAAGPEYIYYPVSSGIARVPIGGGSPQLEFIPLSTQNEKHEWEGEFPYAIAVAGEYLYWTHQYRGKEGVESKGISRAKLNGSEVITNFIAATEQVRGLAIEGEHIYWRQGIHIARANIDGTEVERTFLNVGYDQVGGLATNGRHIYWASSLSGYIGRANLNGTEQNNAWIRPPEGASIVGFVAADEQHVYWEAAPGGAPNKRSVARVAANAGGGGSPSPSEIEEQFVPKPEFFDGGLAVTPSQALTASVSLTGKGGAPLSGKATARGSTVEATVTVTAPGSDTAPVSALAADPSLTITPSSSLTFVSGPSPSSIDGKTIQPGESVHYTDTYTIAGTGHVQAAVEVTGSYEGKPVSTSASTTATLTGCANGKDVELESVRWTGRHDHGDRKSVV